MHPPQQADQTPRPPEHLQEEKSQLEDPGDSDDDDVKALYDAAKAINAGMQVFQSKAHKVLQAAMPRPPRMEEPLGGNPFKEKGSFKNEYILFEELTKGDWAYFEDLKEKVSVAEATARTKVKSLDNLAGYDLHHHEETDSYCLVRAQQSE